MSVTVLELLMGATSAVTELVLSILVALRARDRHEELRVDRAGVGARADADDNGRNVCCISLSGHTRACLLKNEVLSIWTTIAASRRKTFGNRWSDV